MGDIARDSNLFREINNLQQRVANLEKKIMFSVKNDELLGFKIIRGSVASDGTITEGTGTFTINKTLTGRYPTTFIIPFSDTPSVIMTLNTPLTTDSVFDTTFVSTTGFTANTFSDSGFTFADRAYDFIAIGPV